jgi:hypothetical protein
MIPLIRQCNEKRFLMLIFIALYSLCALSEIGWDGVDWIELAQDRDQWRALVNTVMNLRVP